MSDVLTLLAAVPALGDVGGAVLSQVALLIAVLADHGLRTITQLVLALATGADEGLGALVDVMTLLATVAAALRTGVRALFGEVTLLLADAALASGTSLGRLGAVGLVVTAKGVLVDAAGEVCR